MRAVLRNLSADAVCVGRVAVQVATFGLFCAGTCGAVACLF